MAEQSNPKSIDERLDAVTMNLELQIRGTEALRTAFAAQSRDDREKFSSLAQAAAALLAVSGAHEPRLDRLERRAG